MATYNFPQNFLWGASTAGHQVEGNNVNSESWLLEHLPGTIYAEPSGDACDHYHRYPEDLALLAKLGFNSYRFSLEWARIEPEKGEFSRAELDHYRRMLSACHENGLHPVVTLHHFISPRWLIRDGGWVDDKTPDRYAHYCEHVVKHLGDLIGTACTFNEMNLSLILSNMLPFKIEETPFWKTASDAFGVTPDRLGLFQFSTQPKMHEVILKSHRQAFDILHSGKSQFPVGMTLAMMDLQAVPGGEENLKVFQNTLSAQFLEQLRGDDFVGVQTYSRMLVGPDGVVPPAADAKKSQMGEEYYPEAIGGTIRYAAEIAQVPILVTENGVATEDDTQRLEYFQRALRSVADCINDGIDVKGYCAWSAMDNFEWVSGYQPKFGIIGVDRQTQERTPKPSAYWLGDVARENRIK